MQHLRFLIALTIALFGLSHSLNAQTINPNDTILIDGQAFGIVLVSAPDIGITADSTLLDLYAAADEKLGVNPCPVDEARRLFDKVPIAGKGCLNIATEGFPLPNTEGSLWIFKVWEMGPRDSYPWIDGREPVAGWIGDKRHITYYPLRDENVTRQWVFLKPKA